MKTQPNKFSQLIGKHISQLLKTNLLSETTVFQAQPALICPNSAVLTVE